MEEVAKVAEIIPFKTRQQMKMENAMKIMHEWEGYLEWKDANWQKAEEKEVAEEQFLSNEEIEWLNSWVNETDFAKTEVVKGID